jgi:hypothetical protein
MATTLSREEMERAIREGGSVLYQGRTISRVEDLPNAVDLVQGDAAKQAAVRAAIDAQIAALTAQRAQLDSAAPATEEQQEGELSPTDEKPSRKRS